MLLAYETRWSRTERSEGIVLLLLFPFDTMQRSFFFFFFYLAISTPMYQDFKLSWVVVWLGTRTLCKPVSVVDVGFRIRTHLEGNEKKSAIASNQCIQLFLKKHYGSIFFEPVCKPLERILSKYVQLDQAGFVLKREFIRKYSENNKRH